MFAVYGKCNKILDNKVITDFSLVRGLIHLTLLGILSVSILMIIISRMYERLFEFSIKYSKDVKGPPLHFNFTDKINNNKRFFNDLPVSFLMAIPGSGQPRHTSTRATRDGRGLRPINALP